MVREFFLALPRRLEEKLVLRSRVRVLERVRRAWVASSLPHCLSKRRDFQGVFPLIFFLRVTLSTKPSSPFLT